MDALPPMPSYILLEHGKHDGDTLPRSNAGVWVVGNLALVTDKVVILSLRSPDIAGNLCLYRGNDGRTISRIRARVRVKMRIRVRLKFN